MTIRYNDLNEEQMQAALDLAGKALDREQGTGYPGRCAMCWNWLPDGPLLEETDTQVLPVLVTQLGGQCAQAPPHSLPGTEPGTVLHGWPRTRAFNRCAKAVNLSVSQLARRVAHQVASKENNE